MDAAYSALSGAENDLRVAESEERRAISERDAAERYLQQIDSAIDSLHRELDALQRERGELERQLQNLSSSLLSKTQERDRARQKLENLDGRIQQLRDRIAKMENDTGPGKWTCVAVDRGWEEHAGGHPANGQQRDKAHEKAMEACKLVHGDCVVRSCEKDSAELDELRRRLQNFNSERDELYRRIQTLDSEVSNAQYEEQRLRQRISDNDTQARDKQYRITEKQRERDRQQRVIANANEAVLRATRNTDLARSAVIQARQPYLSAKATFDYEERLAQDAYGYYQSVLANYNAALSEVYSQADNAATRDGGREAQERAVVLAQADGDRAGRSAGLAKGTEDIRVRDFRRGYLDGRSAGSSDPFLAGAYAEGGKNGVAVARDKARAEEFPKGFNEALAAHFAASPLGQATVDISESVPSDPGGNGVLLKLKALVIGQVGNPAVKVPNDAVVTPPVVGTIPASVPASLKLYFSPPCTGLVLFEFEAMCRSRYEQSYAAQYSANFQRVYRNGFAAAYTIGANAVYQAELTKVDAVSQAAGRSAGAKDQGLLDGFDRSLAALKSEEFGLGRQAFKQELTKGAAVKLVSAELVESSGDGLFTPGEVAKLKLTVDNYGGEATALGRVRVRLLALSGLGKGSADVRDVPALAGQTRTIVSGVMSLPIQTEAPGDPLEVQAVLETDEGAGFKELARFKATAATGFPIELTKVELMGKPKVGQKIAAKLTFRNRQTVATNVMNSELSTSPAFVAFPEPKIELPVIEAGGETVVETQIEPGPWVGDNTFVNFISKLDLGEGRILRQAFRQMIEIDRAVSLLLFDGNGNAVPSSTIRVRAGTAVVIQPQLKFRAKSSLPGPFVVREAKISNPLITRGNGSTTSVNYGSLSPGTQLTKIRMIYNVPASLAGKQEYIMVQAEEGGRVQHAMMVYLDIQ